MRQEMQAREEAATKIQAVQRGKMTRETMKQAVDNSNAQKETTKPKPSPASAQTTSIERNENEPCQKICSQ